MTNYQQPPGYPPQYAPPQGAPQPVPAAPQYAPPQYQQPPQQPPQQQYQQPPQQQYQQPPQQQYQQPPQQQYQQPAPGYAQQQGYRPPAPPQQSNPMAGIGDVDPTGSRLPHFNADRRYLLRNTKMGFFQGRKDAFVNAEWDILESDDPMLPQGRSAKYMIKWNQDMSLPNFKAMLGAIMGLTDTAEITSRVGETESLDAIDEAKQPFKGAIVELRTSATTTKSGNPFTIHNWYPHSGAAAGVSPQMPPQAPMMQQYAAPPQTQQYAAPGAPAPMAPQPPPYVAPPPAAPAPFPPPGWYPHQQAGYFHNTKEAITELELRQRQAQGRA